MLAGLISVAKGVVTVIMRQMAFLPTPRNATVKVFEQGTGTPIVFLHSGTGSAGEWRGVFSAWPPGYHLIAVDAFRGASFTTLPGQHTIDDFADQVHAVVNYVGQPINLVGFSYGGATALHVATTAPTALASLVVIEPEAYSLLTSSDGPAFTTLRSLCEQCRALVQAGDWFASSEKFIDFYNGPGSFSSWPAARRDAYLEEQRARGDNWDVLFGAPITVGSLASIDLYVHVIEGSETSIVDRKICEVVLRSVKHPSHSVVPGAGHMMPLTHATDLTRLLLQKLP